MKIDRINPKHISVSALVFATLLFSQRIHAQALNMDGQSGIFLQPWAEVVPSPEHKFGGTTASFHIVDAGPVARDYINAGLEEGFGNWLEFGFSRNNHTDGGDPTISPLFNFSGMNIFNVKAKLLVANYHNHKYLPAIAVGGVLRTNDPFVSQAAVHKNATNGDVYLVATKLIVLGNTSLPSWQQAEFAERMRRSTVMAETPSIGKRARSEESGSQFPSRKL